MCVATRWRKAGAAGTKTHR
jgi:hypothetical protein